MISEEQPNGLDLRIYVCNVHGKIRERRSQDGEGKSERERTCSEGRRGAL